MPNISETTKKTCFGRFFSLVILLSGTHTAVADIGSGQIDGGCPDFTVSCPMVYEPVVCDDGNTYFNECAATYWGCTTGCESAGGGVLFMMAESGESVVRADSNVPTRSSPEQQTSFTESHYTGSTFGAVGSGPDEGTCPDFTVFCSMVYDPVSCSDGNTYFNQCAATYWGCAEDCQPAGGEIQFFTTDDNGESGNSPGEIVLAPQAMDSDGTLVMAAATPVNTTVGSASRKSTDEELLSIETFSTAHESLHGSTELNDSGTTLITMGSECPDFTIFCPMVYDPVICDDGNTYFNQCAATYWGCASNCESTGGFEVE